MTRVTPQAHEVVGDALEVGKMLLTGEDSPQPQPLAAPGFVTGLASAPSSLPRQFLGLLVPVIVPPGSWAVLHLPGGSQRVFKPGSYRLWDPGPGQILVQYVDARQQQVRIGPIDGLSADKWQVRLSLIVEIAVADPSIVAAHRDPLGSLRAAVQASVLAYIEQHSHAALTGYDGPCGGIDAPAQAVMDRLRDDAALAGLSVLAVRVVERAGDVRRIEAQSSATVAASQIDAEQQVADARHRAQLLQIAAQTELVERQHALRMSSTAAAAREQLLAQQAEVQHASLAAQIEVVMAEIRAQSAAIAHDEQLWQAGQQRLQLEWERGQQQVREVHETDQHLRLIDAQHAVIHSEGEVALAVQERQHGHLLALAELQQQVASERAAQAQALADRQAHHEQMLAELQLRHSALVVEHQQRLEQWRVQLHDQETSGQRQHERQIAVIAGTAQIAAAAAGEDVASASAHEVADAGLRTLQALAE